jgi:hypothetical protein
VNELIVVLFVYLCVSIIILSRVRADHVGVSVQLGPWKVLTSLPPGSLLVLASNSLWPVIMRFNSFALNVSLCSCNMLNVEVDVG